MRPLPRVIPQCKVRSTVGTPAHLGWVLDMHLRGTDLHNANRAIFSLTFLQEPPLPPFPASHAVPPNPGGCPAVGGWSIGPEASALNLESCQDCACSVRNQRWSFFSLFFQVCKIPATAELGLLRKLWNPINDKTLLFFFFFKKRLYKFSNNLEQLNKLSMKVGPAVAPVGRV